MAGSGAVLAQGHSSGGGGGHVAAASGGHAYGAGGGYGHAGYGWGGYGHAGYGWGGGYGWHGGYYGGWGWRGGYYGPWGAGWGWGLGGLGLGLYFASLPPYYSTLWWGGIPYYYADNNYYVYDSAVGQYQTVAPPPGLDQASAQEPVGTDLIAYPKNGQSADQQAKDKYECHHWAATQSGFDPTQGSTTAATPAKRTDYMRAQAACLEGRGYSVK